MDYQLNTREKQILALKASGYTCTEIGSKLTISRTAVEGVLLRLYPKIGASNDVHAVAIMMADEQLTAESIELPHGMRTMTPS